MGLDTNGASASWHRMWAAAAWLKSAGMVPSTGLVRTRKFDTTRAATAPGPHSSAFSGALHRRTRAYAARDSQGHSHQR